MSSYGSAFDLSRAAADTINEKRSLNSRIHGVAKSGLQMTPQGPKAVSFAGVEYGPRSSVATMNQAAAKLREAGLTAVVRNEPNYKGILVSRR